MRLTTRQGVRRIGYQEHKRRNNLVPDLMLSLGLLILAASVSKEQFFSYPRANTFS